LIDCEGVDDCVSIFGSMSSETAVNFTGGHFNQAVFAVYTYDEMRLNQENSYVPKERFMHLRSQQTAVHILMFSGVLQCSAEEIRFVWPSSLNPPHQLNVVRIQDHHVF